ncbi:hypothetical protein [Paenibacillus dakarensis]|uniref:hypothetical protein n=1 Tax=Paenibacillus dakarensis TaxID=1527293 RepID=UPI0006D57EBC|nr:hypothetical protein [Paenibacillus dakarensis]
MKQLSKIDFNKAREFIKSKARPLEKALFEYEFETGSFQSVIDALLQYQNNDGGFGNALEPDLRCPESSVLATTVALQILDGKVLDDNVKSMVRQTIDYLLHTYNEKRNGWDIIPREAEHSPRAVWWDYGAFRNHWGNPSAEVVGYLITYNSIIPVEMLDELVEYAVQYLMHDCDLSEMHELFCYLRLSEKLNELQYRLIEERLHQFVLNCVPKETVDRKEYGATPLQIINHPNARYYSEYEDVISKELDALIDEQTDEGSWEPNWNWYRFEEEWEMAKEEWKGIITLNNLKILRNFQRIEITEA